MPYLCGLWRFANAYEIINLRGETTTVYKLLDGRYMDCTNTVYIYDGKDTWTDTNGVEWNQEVI